MHNELDQTEEMALVSRCQQGDRSAFAALAEMYWKRIFAWLYSLTQRTHVAEDLTQETFLKAWSGINSFREGAGFRPWLFRIARNSWIDYHRKNRFALLESLPDSITTGEQSPLENILSQENMAALNRQINQLPSKYREALLLRIEESMSFAEIAAVVGEKEETVRWRVYKCRQMLLKLKSEREKVE